jgi:DNA-binding IclR family transcriptional regulator
LVLKLNKQNKAVEDETETPGKDVGKHNISSVVIGIEVLNTVAELGKPSSLKEISSAAGMAPSRAHRYLVSLIQTGMIHQNAKSGRYDLGERIIHLGVMAMGRIDAVELGAEALTRISDITGLDSHLNVWGSNGPTVIKWEQGRLGYAIKLKEGKTLPLLGTATGRVFLSYLPASETEVYLEKELAELRASPTGDQIMTMEDVEKIQIEVQKHGVANAIGTHNFNIAGLSAPVFDREGKICMSISVLGVTGSFGSDLTGVTANHVKAVTQELSSRMGNRKAPKM